MQAKFTSKQRILFILLLFVLSSSRLILEYAFKYQSWQWQLIGIIGYNLFTISSIGGIVTSGLSWRKKIFYVFLAMLAVGVSVLNVLLKA